MATARLTRDERRERTRADLVRAAQRVFLERGFHRASLEEISAAAGYSTGAVYSNFASKDDLFLAVIDARGQARVREYSEEFLTAASFEEGARLAARVSWRAARETPRWVPVLTEFWIHVAERDGVRAGASERHHNTMDAIAELIEELADRHGVKFTMPVRDLARATSSLVRGMELERLLDPGADEAKLFEETWMALVKGAIRK